MAEHPMVWVDDLPENMRDLLKDHRRKVPVPVMNMHPDGVNFMAINLQTVVDCGKQELCGICGKALGYWIAFVGGPVSAANGAYTDPPFHKECAEAAMKLCPHLARKVHRRTPDEKMPADSFAPEGAIETKPPQWIIGLTRRYDMVPYGRGILFRCSVRHRLVYEYDEHGDLQRVDHG